MGKYTPTTVSAGAAISASAIWAEFEAIATAHNAHVASDFSSSWVSSANNTIPPGAVINNRGYFSMTLSAAKTMTGALTSATQQAYCTVPCACSLVRGWAIANTVGAGGTQEVAVFREGTTDARVFSNITLSTQQVPVDAGSPLIGNLAAGDVLSMRVVLPAVETSSFLTFTMLAKSFHREIV